MDERMDEPRIDCADCLKRKRVMFVLLLLVILLFVALAINFVEIRTMKKMSSGIYYTEQECLDEFGLRSHYVAPPSNWTPIVDGSGGGE
jgi:hypothetical protein